MGFKTLREAEYGKVWRDKVFEVMERITAVLHRQGEDEVLAVTQAVGEIGGGTD